ncbi:cobalt/nickel transport system permease protein [Pseudoduganella flava]|uniref:Cobalt ECF transporter T component CbiQ n=1 Tax=Pseudoduganella flava TaxID=871742 RepID=A0A562Q0T8_9BURK|nr:cobalt ECF transporter T component CbiQ [Pseudoduganella flava]QGZ38172.1 cobalt ECF transporter T component CbiQ [Pseudoduganella flava]TWI50305.1 cobalt/nickel transport system permease protein [Pseudoduganella flava]
MQIEAAAQASRWRDATPTAKALFALAGMTAAACARQPATLAALAGALALVTLLAARVPVRLYLAVLLPPLGFLAVSTLTMLVAVDFNGPHWNPAALPLASMTALRALAMLAALLALTLTTPLPQLLGLLRRLRVPEPLLDLMALCYRMLFVLRQAWDEGLAAQSARLGYSGTRVAWRSLGLLTARLAVQVWQRAAALDQAAQARGYAGTLSFLPAVYPQARRQNTCAAIAGTLLIIAVLAGERA